jgi:hypothetical protein
MDGSLGCAGNIIITFSTRTGPRFRARNKIRAILTAFFRGVETFLQGKRPDADVSMTLIRHQHVLSLFLREEEKRKKLAFASLSALTRRGSGI